MKTPRAMLASFALLLVALRATEANPVAKVIELLGSLEAKVIREGEEAQAVYEEFAEWCEDRSKELQFDIKTSKGEILTLKASAAKETADISALEARLEKLAGGLTMNSVELKSATGVRAKEHAVFLKEEAELMGTIDSLQRAILIIEKGTSLLQAKGAKTLVEVLNVLVEGAAISSMDSERLRSLVQPSRADDGGKLSALVQTYAEAGQGELGAPDPSAYGSHSGDVLSTLNGLLDKAEASLADMRSAEMSNLHTFQRIEGQLNGEIKFQSKEIGEAKTAKSAASEAKASAEGDLGVASKSLAASESALAETHANCMSKAEDFEAETKSRAEELQALAAAKKVIKEKSEGADSIAYGLDQQGVTPSFLQVNAAALNPAFKVVRLVRELSRKQKAPALTQLAERMEQRLRLGASEDVFEKIKGLIRDMIEKLLDEASADASKKAYCDKEMGESTDKKEELGDTLDQLSAAIDSKSARSAQLKDEVAKNQKELAELASAQAEMDKIRAQEKAVYDSQKKEMEDGVEGIKVALNILKEYYASDQAHEAADGSSSGVIGLLEVVESDFSKTLAEIQSGEDAAVAQYKTQTGDNEILKTTLDRDVKYKTKESMELDTGIAQLTSDKEGEETQLSAVSKYLQELKDQCIAQPETYAERVGRRNAEIAGLKEALEVLSGETVLLQQTSSRRLRGHLAA